MASPKNIHSDSNAHTEPHSWGAFHTRMVNKKFIILMGLHRPFSLTISLCRCVRSRQDKSQQNHRKPSFFLSLAHPGMSSPLFLPLCGCPFLVSRVHRKLEVSLFMSLQKMWPQFLFLGCQLAHISLLRKRKSRTEHLTVGFLSQRTASGPQTDHRDDMGLQEVTWTDLDQKKHKHVSAKSSPNNPCYLLIFLVLHPARPCAASELTQKKNKAWFILKVQLKQSAKTHRTIQNNVPFKQRFS